MKKTAADKMNDLLGREKEEEADLTS